MKTIFPLLVIVLLISSCIRNAHDSKHTEIKETIVEIMEAYPSSTLIDLYKAFYQDHFGPGHLLADTAAAWNYFIYELQEMKSYGRYTAEPCGMGVNFVRVPMDIVKDSLIDEETYFMAFLQSSGSFTSPDIDKWRHDWDGLALYIEEMNLDLPDFEEDKNFLKTMLEGGETMVHHSEIYRLAYHPHYRIMTLDRWAGLRERIGY